MLIKIVSIIGLSPRHWQSVERREGTRYPERRRQNNRISLLDTGEVTPHAASLDIIFYTYGECTFDDNQSRFFHIEKLSDAY
ncbi:hypothetical protein HAALTHF_50960n [Vreelandella aquamarina]|nr:hypothetical protein HAALTHF_50960n [Halomonas axialensis]